MYGFLWSHNFFCLQFKATSHTRLKAHDHCNVRALIGRKGGDHSYSLHTRRWLPKGPYKSSWQKVLKVNRLYHILYLIQYHLFYITMILCGPEWMIGSNFMLVWFIIYIIFALIVWPTRRNTTLCWWKTKKIKMQMKFKVDIDVNINIMRRWIFGINNVQVLSIKCE